ncbi:hypothetical protein CU097_011034 [Rhizopus azygosporus]|uniref:Uncharacterized protein n=1 Tax=Rhizopus azygosporus TaxID=86630 RepID=A0A367K1N1_RHIAZ|nr:hypothetical protein CU097_011034 [Rhizopus azygosporus]
MSFKAKQRAKHGHLFGDDPLNAALVSSTDDPLFAPTKSSQSTRTSSPVKVDPLSRNDIDSSSSTPLFSRRTKAESIFGDIDVSKLGRRSPNSLRSNKPLEEDEDLFGGARRAPKKPPSIESNGDSMRKQQPVKITTTTTTKPLVHPSSPVKVSTNPPSPAKTPTPPTPIKPSVEDTKSSSFFASASRFFKSSSSTKPSASTSTSSSVSSDIQNQPVPPSVTLPSPPPVDKTVVSVQQQQQTDPPQLQVVNRQVEEEEEENDTNDAIPVIEDEATRAFADETISFSTHAINYTTSLTPDLLIDGIDSLKVRTPLSPSVSSPTHTTTTTTTGGGVELDPWALSISLEPSVSSPITRVPVQEIEPQKRRVFADLITSWNTGQIHREREEVDPDQFFHHIAEEQRDVGFAGISNDSPIKAAPTSVNIWEEVENPWS